MQHRVAAQTTPLQQRQQPQQQSRQQPQQQQKAQSPRMRALGAEQWMQRALELAQEHDLFRQVAFHGRNERGEFVYTVPSRRQPGRYYTQAIDPRHLTVWCACDAHTHGYPCGHAGAAIDLFRRMTYPCLVPEQKTLVRDSLAVEWHQEEYPPFSSSISLDEINATHWRRACDSGVL